MAFVSARTISYENIKDQDGIDIGISITGVIEDDAIPEVYMGTCRIDGDQFANLPASDPALENTPDDPRYQAIQAISAAFVRTAHAAWSTAYHARPVVVARPAEEVAMLPVLTELPGE